MFENVTSRPSDDWQQKQENLGQLLKNHRKVVFDEKEMIRKIESRYANINFMMQVLEMSEHLQKAVQLLELNEKEFVDEWTGTPVGHNVEIRSLLKKVYKTLDNMEGFYPHQRP